LSTASDSATGEPARALRLGALFFKYRDILFPLVLLALAFGTRPRLFLGETRTDVALDFVGIGLALVGQVLRAVTIGLQYIRRGGKNKQVYAKSLVVGGVFAHCRNPLYLGNILGILGMMLIHNGIWMYAIGVPYFALAYASIIAEEERYLRGRFGAEYDGYCRRVPRLRVRPTGLLATLRSVPFQWKRLVAKEYGTTFSGSSALLGLLIWERVRLDEYGASSRAITIIASIWAVLLLGYLIARSLKKHGRLDDER
jgi:protein-S-isoprenylcysteine O-methyltransferase Ste14